MKFNELTCVRTLKDFPEHGIKKGDIGVVIIAFTKPNEAYKVEFDADMGIEKLINDRDLYLMLFDDEMKKVYEVKLAKHRYNYFTGWCVSYSGIVLFVDNMLDTENNTDDLTIDFVYPK